MKNENEIRSDVLTHIKHFLKIISTIQNLIGGYTQTQTGHENRISFFLQDKESRLTRWDVAKIILLAVESFHCLVHEDTEEGNSSAIQLKRLATSY